MRLTSKRRRPTSALRDLFPGDDVQRVLEALRWSCRDLRKQNDTEFEDRITARLWKGLNRREPFRDGPLHVGLQAAVLDSHSAREAPEGRVDLQVTCGKGPDVYFAIEAKRLRVRHAGGRIQTGAPEYVDEGMMRFVNGQYAPRMSAGSMLGYVFDGNIVRARADVSGAINARRAALRLAAPQILNRSRMPVIPPVDETRHRLPRRNFTLYHMLTPV